MAPRPEPPRTVLSLCAGIGGLELGVAGAVARLGGRLRTVLACERQAYAAAVLVVRMEDASLDPHLVWDDLTTFDGIPFRDRVDIVVAGVPCQPFSVAGEQRGLDDERWIWKDVWRIVCEVRPRFLLVENVPGFRSKGLPAVLGTLAEAGWVAEWCSVSAASVGAPHLRERVFCLAADPERVAVRIEQGRSSRTGRGGALQPDDDDDGAQGRATLAHHHDDRLQGVGRSGLLDGKRALQRDDVDGRRGPGVLADTDGERSDRWRADRRRQEGVEDLGPDPRRDAAYYYGARLQGPSLSRGRVAEPGRAWDWESAPEPSFHRVDDGPPHELDRDWADRIHACGNAVVPQCAERAFLTLWDRIHDPENGAW